MRAFLATRKDWRGKPLFFSGTRFELQNTNTKRKKPKTQLTLSLDDSVPLDHVVVSTTVVLHSPDPPHYAATDSDLHAWFFDVELSMDDFDARPNGAKKVARPAKAAPWQSAKGPTVCVAGC